LTNLEDYESVNQQKQKIIGKEMFFHGTVKNNKFFNNAELIIDNVEEVDLDSFLCRLKKQNEKYFRKILGFLFSRLLLLF